MADLVCGVLEVLGKTGRGCDGFTAGFLNNQQERCVIFDYRRNDWSCILQDSPLMAVYAVINGKCFECHTPDHSTSTCGGEIAYTVLKTQLGFENRSLIDRVKVKPHGQVLKVLKPPENISPKALLMTPASTIHTYLLSTPLVNPSVSAVEVRDPAAQGGRKYDVFLRASSISHNGMKNSPRVCESSRVLPVYMAAYFKGLTYQPYLELPANRWRPQTDKPLTVTVC
jgi:hypothetical protein